MLEAIILMEPGVSLNTLIVIVLVEIFRLVICVRAFGNVIANWFIAALTRDSGIHNRSG
jgi:hypothetical protein